VWAKPGSKYVAEFLGLGNVIEGKERGKKKDGKWIVESGYGVFDVECEHKHSKGDKINLLLRAERRAGVSPARRRSAVTSVSGVIKDIIFQQDYYKITFDNGLYIYLDESPKIGQKISVPIKVECLA
jgi:ABC-type Fe3+/spermidine/putrescine transport system ATPase subunit